MIKGLYKATVEISFLIDENDSSFLPFEQMQEKVINGVTPILKSMIEDEFSDVATVEISQEYADLWRYKDCLVRGD